MSIDVNVSVENNVSPALRAYIDALTGSKAAELSAAGGRGAAAAAKIYHAEFGQAGRWKGDRYMIGTYTRAGEFAAKVANGWSFTSSDKESAVITNDAEFYAHKVRGGTITPKRAKALTIPLIPDAKGLRVADYVRNTGRRLFTIKGKSALFERIESITTGDRGRRSSPGASIIRTNTIRAVYALVKSVTQGPWQGARPPDDLLAEKFSASYRAALIRTIEAES